MSVEQPRLQNNAVEHAQLNQLPLGYCADTIVQAPPRCGIYYLLDSTGRLVYIGQSCHVLRRLGNHDKPWTYAHVRAVPQQTLNICEAVEIRRYLPPFNGAMGPGGYLAAMLEQWWTELPTVSFILQNKYHFGALCLIHAKGGMLWMEESGHVAARWPATLDKMYPANVWTQFEDAVRWVDSRIPCRILR